MTSILDAIKSVFLAVVGWITDSLEALMPIFYTAEEGLSLIGTMSIISVAIAFVFLIMRVIQNFLGFRS